MMMMTVAIKITQINHTNGDNEVMKNYHSHHHSHDDFPFIHCYQHFLFHHYYLENLKLKYTPNHGSHGVVTFFVTNYVNFSP